MPTYPSLAFPVNEETVLVNLKQRVLLELDVVAVLEPPIEAASLQKGLGHWYSPVEFEFLRHVGLLKNGAGALKNHIVVRMNVVWNGTVRLFSLAICLFTHFRRAFSSLFTFDVAVTSQATVR